jgi:thymidylate synthase
MTIADLKFKTNIENIVKNGCSDEGVRPLWQDGTPANSKFITQVWEQYDLAAGELPITSLRKIPWKSGIKEMLWIYQDESNDLQLLKEKYNVHWWDSWESNMEPGTIGRRYGYTVKKWDQMGNLLRNLKDSPYSRRHIISLWDFDNFFKSDGLYPCAFQTLWSVRKDESGKEVLDLTLVQRSCDYLTAGHINKIQYVALQMMVARHCGLELGKFCHLVQNLHIYDRHMWQAGVLLEREYSDSKPKLILNPDKTNFYDITVDDFTMVDYNPIEPNFKFELAI